MGTERRSNRKKKKKTKFVLNSIAKLAVNVFVVYTRRLVANELGEIFFFYYFFFFFVLRLKET